MAQIFPSGANTIARVSVFAAAVLPVALVAAATTVARSPYNTKAGVPLDQPVPFSHQHHVSELGIDCRYCHSTVEKAAFAGLPSTETCMSCHSQIWTNSPLLEPVRASWATGQPIRWVRVNKLPDFVYFDHSIHVNRGIQCNICHGPVQQMQMTYKGKPFFMAWCLECHRNPAAFAREPSQEFEIYRKDQRGERLSAEERAILDDRPFRRTKEEIDGAHARLVGQGVKTEQLADCWVCHR